MSGDTRTPTERESFAEVLQHLCMRPKMHTFTGSFREAVIYIEAYVRGSHTPRGQVNLESGMEPFGRWLARRHGHDQSQHWHQVLLEHCGGDEQRALQELWPCYEQYLAAGEENLTNEARLPPANP
jgi:hypothetical protein